jgi:aminoglycoside 6-adenylyltransferase
MEDPNTLLRSILSWAQGDDRVEAVVQTGSRARGRRVDDFSDLDIELLGPRPFDLARDPSWIRSFGEPMVTLALDNDEPAGLGWPTRLVVFAQGRKVDFMLAGPRRIEDMLLHGLDDVYEHGYVVHLDKTGRTSRLPEPRMEPPTPRLPSQAEFSGVESEFWFEATQVAVYLARRDLWVVKFREHTMHQCLLRMLEWLVESDPVAPGYTWHIGHHMDEWLPEREFEGVQQVFTRSDVGDTLRGLSASMGLFADVSARVAGRLNLSVRSDLPDRVREHLATVAGEPGA